VLGKERIRLLANGTPKLIFRELLRRKPFSEQGVQFFHCSRETRHYALLHRRQSSLNNFLNGLISTATEDRSDAALLFRREMNRHGFVGLWVRHLQVKPKTAFGQVECGPGALAGAGKRLGPETYNNVKDKIQTGRDSAGF